MSLKSNRRSRFFLSSLPAKPESLPGSVVPLPHPESHHALRVLRLSAGTEIETVDKSTGFTLVGPLVIIDGTAHLSCNEVLAPTKAARSLSVLVPLLKAGNTELACEKATELGASTIFVWQAERSVARIRTAEDIEHRTRKILNVVHTAVKQCSRPTLPEVFVVPSLEEALNHHAFPRESTKLVCSLRPTAIPITERAIHGPMITLAVGPEGDLSDTELARLLSADFQEISLGEEVLRAETAAIVSIAMVKALWKDYRHEMSGL